MTLAYFVTTAMLCAWWYWHTRRSARTIRANREKQPNWLD